MVEFGNLSPDGTYTVIKNIPQEKNSSVSSNFGFPNKEDDKTYWIFLVVFWILALVMLYLVK